MAALAPPSASPRRTAWIFWLSVAGVYAVLIASVALATQARVAGAWALAGVAFLVIGWLQYVLIQAMHEACHQARSGVANSVSALLLFHAMA